MSSILLQPIVAIPSLPRLIQLPHILKTQNLDGSQGSNREQVHLCQLRANNDYEAIQCWLKEYQHKETTYRLYQKEAERLLLWCIYQRKKPLSSLDREDFEAYFRFLQDPQPRHLWCGRAGGRGHHRGEAHWRPFAGPLSATTLATSITVIKSLMSYLNEGRYLTFNPLVLSRRKIGAFASNEERALKIQERVLELDLWNALIDTLDHLPETTDEEKADNERLRWLVSISYLLGLRVSELEKHPWSAFRQVNDKWWFYVIGKGDKAGKIPVNDELLAATIRFRTYFKYTTALPTPEDDKPIIPSWRSAKSLTGRYMNKLLKKLALRTIALHFTNQSDKAAKLKKFSIHWLRHQSASMQDLVGIAEKDIQANHRHSKAETTRGYIHALDEQRHEAMQRLTLRANVL